MKALTMDSEFILISMAAIPAGKPLPTDVYFRLAPGRFLKRFKKGDTLEPSDLAPYVDRAGTGSFYARKTDLESLVEERTERLDRLIDEPDAPPERLRSAASDTLEVVQNIVSELGITPEVESLAKRTVSLVLKAVGNTPSLADILSRFRKLEGTYIASHSTMLAEISCAIAHRVGWSSAPTFMKLTVASILHDLTLTDQRLAKGRSIEEVSKSEIFTPADLQAFKLHPTKAAEYARKFHQIPPDVDTILVQHHERPDGTGFPRGLYHQRISPLSCLFIIAHDLLDAFLAAPEGEPIERQLDTFLGDRRDAYDAGTFRKLRDSLATGIPLTS
jgi:hypothetical protein